MNDIGFDIACPQPAGQPESVTASLESYGDALDLPACLGCLVLPPLHQPQQCLLVDRPLLQRMALDPRYNPGDEPTRFAHLDDSNQRPIVIESGEGSAHIVGLWHGAPIGWSLQRQRWQAFQRAP